MASYKLIVKNAKVILKTVTNSVLNITGIRDLLTGSGSVDSNTKIDWTLQHYTNTAANFTSTNPILLVGQVGIETDDLLTAPKYKIGDGVTAWNTLPYNSSGGGGLSGLTTNKVLKAGSATTAVDSNITDDGSNLNYNSIKIGKGNGSLSTNLALGEQTLDSITSGTNNTSVGFASQKYTTTGQFNTSVGSTALQNNTTGQVNTAFGFGTLLSNTTGSFNEAFGYQALQSNTTGTDNAAFGYLALQNNTTAMLNSAFGHSASQGNTTGTKNTSFGAYALTVNSTGSFNTGIGQNALASLSSGDGNTSIGLNSLYSNTTGSNNVALGFAAGFYETGSNKLFIDNAFRNNEADGRAKALVYGVFDSSPSNQYFTVNGNIASSLLTSSELTATDASKNIVSLPVATYPSLTELSYVKGLTSAVQTQLNNKVSNESVILNPAATLNPADATTYYFGSFISTAPTTIAAARRVYLGKDCSIIGATFTLLVSSTLGTSEDINVYIRVNNTTDYSIGTIKANSSTQQILINTSMSIVLISTDYFEIKMVMPTFVTNPVNVSFSSVVNIR